jgi:hypothetical protein
MNLLAIAIYRTPKTAQNKTDRNSSIRTGVLPRGVVTMRDSSFGQGKFYKGVAKP